MIKLLKEVNIWDYESLRKLRDRELDLERFEEIQKMTIKEKEEEIKKITGREFKIGEGSIDNVDETLYNIPGYGTSSTISIFYKNNGMVYVEVIAKLGEGEYMKKNSFIIDKNEDADKNRGMGKIKNIIEVKKKKAEGIERDNLIKRHTIMDIMNMKLILENF